MFARQGVRTVVGPPSPPHPAAILNAMTQPVIVLDRGRRVRFLNVDAQHFLQAGASALLDSDLADALPADSPVFSLVAKVFAEGSSMSEYGVVIETPRIGRRACT